MTRNTRGGWNISWVRLVLGRLRKSHPLLKLFPRSSGKRFYLSSILVIFSSPSLWRRSPASSAWAGPAVWTRPATWTRTAARTSPGAKAGWRASPGSAARPRGAQLWLTLVRIVLFIFSWQAFTSFICFKVYERRFAALINESLGLAILVPFLLKGCYWSMATLVVEELASILMSGQLSSAGKPRDVF